MQVYPLYINGEFKETAKKQDVIDPSTGRVFVQVSMAQAGEIEATLAAARIAFDAGEWPRLSLAHRKEYILKISQGIFEHAAELAQLESTNAGKPIKETTFMDVPSAAKSFEHFANNLEKYLTGETLALENTQCKITHEPRGVAVLIVPWNYPLIIAAWKMSQALAAGNTIIVKPSSLTPVSLLALAKIIHAAGLPKGVVNIINGSGDAVGEALCADKRVDMISFTGSNEVGRKIIQYTSQNVKKSIMELGGKSASLIFKDVDLDVAVNSTLCSIFLNQGQMCTAMSRIFVEDDIYDAFVKEFVARAKRIKVGPALDYETQMGPLISDSQRKKVQAFIEKARAEGAEVLCGGKIPQDAHHKNGYFFEPTVLAHVTPRMTIFKTEVFGPVACIAPFKDTEEAVALANASDYGLACCIWSKDQARIEEVNKKINAGIIWVNTYGMFYNEAPYGGFKQSGFGKELGIEGFLEYTRLKNTIVDASEGGKPLVSYWYGM